MGLKYRTMSNKEILEEAAERLVNRPYGDVVSKSSFIAGAKWQSEQMFELMNQYTDDVMAGCNLRAEEWVSQFKKQNNEQ
jgi:hypothetical protein